MLKWTISPDEMTLESKIADRAIAMARTAGIQYDKMTAVMDIDAVHSNGNPLRLQELLESDDLDFAHDIFGILAHLDRNTGRLLDCFSPRYSRAAN